jgi:succinate dehydrogenase / fumarate reductase flavoprotein subunit
VFGRRAGIGAAEAANAAPAPSLPQEQLDEAIAEVDHYLGGPGAEDPYAMHKELQKVMGDGVGIFRDAQGLSAAITQLEVLDQRAANLHSPSNRLDYNPGWQLCREMRNMITVSLAVARAALMREESRGGHSRLDHPRYDEYWSDHNIVIRREDDDNMVLEPRDVVKLDSLSELVEARKEAERV